MTCRGAWKLSHGMPDSGEKSSENAHLSVLIIDDQPTSATGPAASSGLGITNVTEAIDGRDAIAKVTNPGAQLRPHHLRPRHAGPRRQSKPSARSPHSASIPRSRSSAWKRNASSRWPRCSSSRRASGSSGAIAKPLTAEKVDKLLARMRAGARRARESGDRAGATTSPTRSCATNCASCTSRKSNEYAPVCRRGSRSCAGNTRASACSSRARSSRSSRAPTSYSALLIDYSLEEAIACAGRWLAIGRELRVAVNLSARAFDRLDLPERIEAIARKHSACHPTYHDRGHRDAGRPRRDPHARRRHAPATQALQPLGGRLRHGPLRAPATAGPPVQRTEDRPPVRGRLLGIVGQAVGGGGEPGAGAEPEAGVRGRRRADDRRLGPARRAGVRRGAGVLHRAADGEEGLDTWAASWGAREG